EAAILRDLPRDYLEGLALNIPEGMRKLIRDVITVLLERLEVPPEEIEAVTEHVKKREDRTMFDGLVKVVLEDRQLAREEGIQIGTEKGREEAYEEKLASARRLKKYGIPVEIIASSLELGTEEVAAL
ncbi:MAG: hypothetical protein LBC60_02745, partial [Spirochaetaceae bacterium]|nr:hypothetical protein [Spirochaetaceae bacterium]